MKANSRHPAQAFLNQRTKNLAFFQRYFPGIYQYFSQYSMRERKLDILPERGECDLLEDGRHLYQGESIAYAKKEVATFLAAYDYGSRIHSFEPLPVDSYQNRRLFALHMREVYEKYASFNPAYSGYWLDDFMPLVVFLGVGLGRHIDILTKVRDIDHVVVFEWDMDFFAASLYAVDWQEIALPHLLDDTKSFTFVLTPGAEHDDHRFGALWNHLLHLCPIFPTATLFYNHRGRPESDWIISKINKDIYVHLFSFGNVDDELNQLNNVKHNIAAGRPFLKKRASDPLHATVCVVGSGPSLDARVEELRQLQDSAVVFSCGTALNALLGHGIIPDFHIELESDFNAYAMQSLTENKKQLSRIHLLGAVQLNPLMYELMGDALMFCKGDGPLAFWLKDAVDAIPGATPTCTNAALALAFYFGFENIALFGMDFGFPEKMQHHARGTAYYQESVAKTSKVLRDDEIISVPGASGQTVQSTPFLYAAKRRIDSLLAGRKQRIFNCSNGAVLENARWMPPGEAHNALTPEGMQREAVLEQIRGSSAQAVAPAEFDALLTQINAHAETFLGEVAQRLDGGPVRTKRDFSRFVSWVISRLQALETTDTGLYYFLRGAIWHYLLAGYTHAFSLQQVEEQNRYLSFWETSFAGFLTALRTRIHQVFFKQQSMATDEMVHVSLYHPVTEDLNWMVQSLDWEYQGYSIVDGKIEANDITFEFEGYCFDGKKFHSC